MSDPFLDPSVSAARSNPARIARIGLTSKCVRLAAIDEYGHPVIARNEENEQVGQRVASGFLLREGDNLYLYTCWHVVTGLDFREPTLPPAGRARTIFLDVSLQEAQPAGATLEGIGGSRVVRLPLYDLKESPPRPLWEQYRQARSCPNIEIAGILAPRYNDIARLRVSEQGFFVSDALQVFSTRDLWRDYIAPGDTLYVLGFPYGFSGSDRHTQAVLLTRYAAQMGIAGQDDGPYLDSPCAPGMSGGPVVIEMGGLTFLAGIYTGSRFPDGPKQKPNQLTALGTYCPLVSLLCGQSNEFTSHMATSNWASSNE